MGLISNRRSHVKNESNEIDKYKHLKTHAEEMEDKELRSLIKIFEEENMVGANELSLRIATALGDRDLKPKKKPEPKPQHNKTKLESIQEKSPTKFKSFLNTTHSKIKSK